MIEDVKSWLGVAALLISVGGFVYSWLTSGSKTNATELANLKKENAVALGEIDDRLDDHGRRIQTVESELKHLPDKDSVVELKLAMAELKGTVGRLDESLGSVQRTVIRIDDYLRQGTGK